MLMLMVMKGSLPAIAGATLPIPCYVVWSMQLMLRPSTPIGNQYVCDLQINYNDLFSGQETGIIVPAMTARMPCPMSHCLSAWWTAAETFLYHVWTEEFQSTHRCQVAMGTLPFTLLSFYWCFYKVRTVHVFFISITNDSRSHFIYTYTHPHTRFAREHIPVGVEIGHYCVGRCPSIYGSWVLCRPTADYNCKRICWSAVLFKMTEYLSKHVSIIIRYDVMTFQTLSMLLAPWAI